MTQNFELETILSVITGINFTDDFNKVFALFWYAYNDNLISPTGLGALKNDLREHLLTIHPELAEAVYNRRVDNMDTWITEQKIKFGEFLPVSRIGETLDNENRQR